MGLLCCDLDNTLVDRDDAFLRWARTFAAAHGRDDDFVAWLVEIDGDGFGPRPEFYVHIHTRLGLTTPVDDLVAAYYRDFLPQFRAEEDVRAALARARAAGWRIAIVTNGPGTQLEKIRHAGLDTLVDAWCISEVEGTSKPDAGLVELAAHRTGGDLEHAWMIGDSPEADIGGAAAMGLPSVWLHRGRDWVDNRFAPTRVVGNVIQGLSAIMAAQ